MEEIVERVRRLGAAVPLRHISDALLLALLAQSDYLPDAVNAGTILFERGEDITHWYLLLSGELELYVASTITTSSTSSGRFPPLASSGHRNDWTHARVGRKVVRLRTLSAGAIFGELDQTCHTCSARVNLAAEFVRIPQEHFLALYSKHADHLQPYILVMEDLVAENANYLTAPPLADRLPRQETRRTRPRDMGNLQGSEIGSSKSGPRRRNKFNSADQSSCHGGPHDVANGVSLTYPDVMHFTSVQWTNRGRESPMPPVALLANLFELNNSMPLQSRVRDAALLLKRTMQLRSPWLITDHRIQTATGAYEVYPNSMMGSEMSRWLSELCAEIFAATHAIAQSPCKDDEMTAMIDALADQIRADAGLPSTRNAAARTFGPLQLIGIWQALLDSHHLSQVNFDMHFKDKPNVLYQWSINDPFEAFYKSRANFYFNSVAPMLSAASATAAYAPHVGWGAAASEFFGGRLLPPLSSAMSAATNFDALLLCGGSGGAVGSNEHSDDDDDDLSMERHGAGGDSPPSLPDLQSAVFLLSSHGLDSLLKEILCKPSDDRTPAELDLVYEELLHVKAFSHLSSMVKRELARVIRFEQYAHSGTVLFRQGEAGDSWFIIWRCGSVDVSIIGKGVVCVLHEGDDFGKLALVNDAPRAATVTVRDHNSQFLRIDKHDFNRILRDVEENTIRLKERGQDVLVLERVSPHGAMSGCHPLHNPGAQSTSAGPDKQQCCYSIMAGIPEKMVEYLLETRVDPVSIYAVPFSASRTAADEPAAADYHRHKRFSGTSPYEIFAATDALTRSCCIDYSELPLRYVDDEAAAASYSSSGGYVSDGNMNYCGSAASNGTAVSAPYSATTPPRRRKSAGKSHSIKSSDPISTATGPPFVFVVENFDTSLEDFLLTHVIFMPSNVLCNYLKVYYNRCRQPLAHSYAHGSTLPLPPQLTPRNLRGRTTYDGCSLTESDLEDLHEQLAAKRRVVAFLVIWQHVLGIHFFLDPVANSFIEEIYCCVLEDVKTIPSMAPVVELAGQLRQLREYAMTLLTRHPTVVLDCGVYSSQAPAPDPILPTDSCNQCIYLADTTFITIDVRLDKSAAEIAAMARSKIRRQRRVLPRTAKEASHLQQNGFFHLDDSDELRISRDILTAADVDAAAKCLAKEVSEEATDEEPCFLVEVKSNGERVVYAPTEVSLPTMLSLNGRLYVIFAEEIDSLVPMPSQDGPTHSVHHSVLELLRSREIAQQLAIFHTQLFNATDEIELIFQVIGRDQFPGRSSSNLDLLLRRFNEVQYWTSTEILLAPTVAKRFSILRKFIKIALHSKHMGDLMSVFAITLGLSNVAVSRLTHLWTKLPAKLRRTYAEFEALLDPSRNHRVYRLLVAKLNPPIVPFVPLLLKDLTFMHEGNKTSFAGLVNFEKMHMIASVLRSFRNCKASKYHFGMLAPSKRKNFQGLIRNFRVIDNQRRLMDLSYAIEEPSQSSYHHSHHNHHQQQQPQEHRPPLDESPISANSQGL